MEWYIEIKIDINQQTYYLLIEFYHSGQARFAQKYGEDIYNDAVKPVLIKNGITGAKIAFIPKQLYLSSKR
jgi:hypothetical protein